MVKSGSIPTQKHIVLIGTVFIFLALFLLIYTRVYGQVLTSTPVIEPVPVVVTPPKEKTPEEHVAFFAEKFKVSPKLAYAIASCESLDHRTGKLNPKAKNTGSTASGLFQFLKGSWRGYAIQYWGKVEGHDVFDAEDNAELGNWVLSKYGTRDWDASSSCWKIKIRT